MVFFTGIPYEDPEVFRVTIKGIVDSIHADCHTQLVARELWGMDVGRDMVEWADIAVRYNNTQG